MGRRNIQNYLEERLSSDINQEQLFSSADLQNILMALFTGDGVYPAPQTPVSGFISGFQVTPGSGLIVNVNPTLAATAASGLVPGIGFFFDPANSVGVSNSDASTPSVPGAGIDLTDSPFRIMFLNSVVSLALSAADLTNPRYDLVQCKWNQTVSNKTTRQIWTPTSSTTGYWTPTSVYKQQEPDCTLSVKTGTPGVSPVVPTPDANNLTVCSVYVAANATSLTQSNINDLRNLIGINLRNNTQMTASDGTVHSIQLVLVSPGVYQWKIT